MALVSKKGGPYTKQEREERRNKVFKLHFEYGYSSSQISELLKVNRNTINTYISFLYSQLREEHDKIPYNYWFDKQLTRVNL